jgi:XTP/dITP diphosphohydrolase
VDSVLVATTNLGKLAEFSHMLASLPLVTPPIRVLTVSDLPTDPGDVEETGTTFWENAILKAQTYAARTGLPALADDSGLAVDALGGAPGVYSARYAPTPAARIEKLLTALANVPDAQRTAHFVCVVALATPDGRLIAAEGRVEGKITFAPRGSGGFGYDPIFELPNGQTMAELSAEAKNTLSHRGRALERLRPLAAALAALP